MTLPTYTHKKRRHLKFGEETQTFSVKIPKSTILKIRDRQLDMGQIIYDMVEQNLSPYGKSEPIVLDLRSGLVIKLVRLMVEQNVTAPEDYFTEAEEALLRKVATEEL